MKPLTKEQLRDNAAAILAFADGKPIQYDSSDIGSTIPIWDDTKDITEIHIIPHRPKPQPVSRPWSKPEDVPGPVCWLRFSSSDRFYLVTQIFTEGMWFISLGRLAWDELDVYQYSTDCKTWKPCTVED